MRTLSLLLVLLIACSPIEPTGVPILSADLALADLAGQPSDLAVVASPTRIIQRTWTGNDGVVVKLPDLYDTVEKFSCAIDKASDGVPRCLPSRFTMYFQDASCTKPVLLSVPGCAVDKYVNVINIACSTTKILGTYKVGGRITLFKMYLQSITPPILCQDASASIGTNDIYDTSPVPPSTFAAGTFNY